MRSHSSPSLYKPVLAIICFFLFIGQPAGYAQQKSSLAGYGKATYALQSKGKFMRSWLVAGPFAISTDTTEPDNTSQEKAFRSDLVTTIAVTAEAPIPPVTDGEKKIAWQPVAAPDDIINLDSLFNHKNFAYAYALAEISAPEATKVILGIGGDDAVKVWLNGKLIFDTWVPRQVMKDNEQLLLPLVKGSNQLLLKVQNVKGGWGFVSRILDASALADQLTAAVSGGVMEKATMLIEGGADVNAKNEDGVSPAAAARITGRDDMLQLLVSKGARDTTVPSPDRLVDNLYRSLNGQPLPGIAVLVAKDKDVLYRKAFGKADISKQNAVVPETKFRIGSITKQFTAAAILRMQEKKLLNIGDPLSKYIPDFPRGNEVTLRMLLNHTSGIHSYTEEDGFFDKVTTTIAPDSLLAMIKKYPYDFNPGEKMHYDNSGFFILGYIIAKISGKPYASYLKENFFDPLGMTNTGIYYTGIQLEHEAKGYERKSEHNYVPALNWDMSWAGGAGAIYSTVEDLLKWNLALHGGKVLAKSSFDSATKPTVMADGQPPSMQYGFGLGLSEFRGQETVGHSGGLHGFVSQLVYFKKQKMTIVLLSNTSQPEVKFDPNKVAEAFLWPQMSKQSSDTLFASKKLNLQPFTGRYEMPGAGVMSITTDNGHLFAQLTGQGKYEIYPKSENEFFWKVVEARLKFEKNEKGETDQAILFQNGQQLHFTRISEEKIIAVDSAALDVYIGKYKLNDQLIVTIFKEKGQLYAQATGQGKVLMEPIATDRFVIKEINAHLQFVKNDQGKIASMKLNMQGENSDLPRME